MPIRKLVVFMAAAGFSLCLSAQSARSVKDGVYTDAQAAKGKAVYANECLSCHGDDLLGSGPFPALAGEDFQKEWQGQTLGDLFDRMSKTMPATKPGSLNAQQNADLLAFLLKSNGFPAGKADLPADPGVLKAVRFGAAK